MASGSFLVIKNSTTNYLKKQEVIAVEYVVPNNNSKPFTLCNEQMLIKYNLNLNKVKIMRFIKNKKVLDY